MQLILAYSQLETPKYAQTESYGLGLCDIAYGYV
jgi:hypothetical protein